MSGAALVLGFLAFCIALKNSSRLDEMRETTNSQLLKLTKSLKQQQENVRQHLYQ